MQNYSFFSKYNSVLEMCSHYFWTLRIHELPVVCEDPPTRVWSLMNDVGGGGMAFISLSFAVKKKKKVNTGNLYQTRQCEHFISFLCYVSPYLWFNLH